MNTLQVTYIVYPPNLQDNPHNQSFENKLAEKIYLFLTTGKPDFSKAFENKYLLRQLKNTEIESREYEDLIFHHMTITEDTYQIIASAMDDLDKIKTDTDTSLNGIIRRLLEDADFRVLVQNIDNFLDIELANRIIEEANVRGISPKEVLKQDYILKVENMSSVELETNDEIAQI